MTTAEPIEILWTLVGGIGIGAWIIIARMVLTDRIRNRGRNGHLRILSTMDIALVLTMLSILVCFVIPGVLLLTVPSQESTALEPNTERNATIIRIMFVMAEVLIVIFGVTWLRLRKQFDDYVAQPNKRATDMRRDDDGTQMGMPSAQ